MTDYIQKFVIPVGRAGAPSHYKPEFADIAIQAGAAGASVTGVWAAITRAGYRVSLDTFRDWLDPNNKVYRPDFHAAVKEGQALALDLFEKICIDAAMGLLPKHSSATTVFVMKNRFRRTYRDESFQNVSSNSMVKITKDMDPQLAAKNYKELILDSRKEMTYEEFMAEDV